MSEKAQNPAQVDCPAQIDFRGLIGCHSLQGASLASDAFFPFSWNDSVEKACQAGIKAIAHPGGSVRDQDAIDCCNKYGVVLVTTDVRHFKH